MVHQLMARRCGSLFNALLVLQPIGAPGWADDNKDVWQVRAVVLDGFALAYCLRNFDEHLLFGVVVQCLYTV